VRREYEADLARFLDVDVRVVAGLLGRVGDAIDERLRLLEILEVEAARDRAVLFGPTAQLPQPLGDLALVQFGRRCGHGVLLRL